MTAEQLSLLADEEPDRSTTGDDRLPPDQPARDRTAADLSSTLFVEAGAGSGKTRALVDRILALVDNGAELDQIAAITFTEKAAAELRHRVRSRLEAVSSGDDAAAAHRASAALHQLDGAAISTLHAFAQRLLFEHPIEAGLPPGVEVLDEIGSQVDFDERWQNALPGLFDDPDLAGPLLLADVFGIAVGDLRTLALQLEADWDLVAERLPPTAAPIEVAVGPAIEAIRGLARHLDGCSDHANKLAARIAECIDHADALAEVAEGETNDEVDRLVDLAELLDRTHPSFSTGGKPYTILGNKRDWASPEAQDAAKLALFEAGEVRALARQQLATSVVSVLARRIGDLVLDAADQRRVEGRLRFHDLLVLARELLRSPEHGLAVRTAVHQRYKRLLIDEFQDTDPIQVELATRIAAAPDHDAGTDWRDLPTDPGHLFFVGDPKQSIYRFRRADIAVYLQAQGRFGGHGGTVALTTNFRSTRPIIEWVNTVFARLIIASPDAQPQYRALSAWRPPPPSGPGIAVVGAAAHGQAQRADELRRFEAADVVGAITAAMDERWPVGDETGHDGWRDPRLGDITILLPARTSLPALERALEDASIPYRAESASLVYATPEVRDLLMVARAVDDPTDELATVAALRTAGLGCGDDDLLRYKRALHGGWNHQAIAADLPDADPVVRGLRWMGSLHTERAWRSPAQLLDRIVADRRLLELGVTDHRHREVWRRLRFVIDQARAWTDATGGNLREYLAWARLQASESARVAETILPESDADAVRIMTIHGSKGLEFPITIVSGLTTQPQGRNQAVTVLWPPEGPPGFRMRGGTATPEYEAFAPLDELLDAHERLRLLYVACTRARDHLVVSMHRNETGSGRSLAEQLASAAGHEAAPALVAPDGALEPRDWKDREPEAVDLPPREEWSARRTAALTNGSRSRTIAATTLARLVTESADPGLDKGSRDLDLPPWQKGRYGTAVGRAVHAVLQSADLQPEAPLRTLAGAQAAAEGVHGQREIIERLARSALRSDVVGEAAANRHWRELFVAAPLGDRLLEGYIDLLYQRGDGVVVVDYKTDAWGTLDELDAKVHRYRLQTAAYAVALESATGLHVTEAVLLFLAEDVATPRVVPDLDGARADVIRLAPAVLLGGEATADD